MKNMMKMLAYLLNILILFNFSKFVYSQEEEGEIVQKRYEWFYRTRAYPFDTIPANALKNAAQQRDALISSQGYLQQGLNNDWNFIGPQPYNGIEPPDAGRVKQIKYDPRDPSGNTIYIAGSNGGIWKTTDGGNTWANKSSNLPILSSQAIELDAQHNILYFGTGEQTYYIAEYGGMGLYKSTDDGGTWTNIWGDNPAYFTSVIFKITIAPNDPTGHTIYVAEGTGLFRTTDGGSSWAKILPATGNRVCTDVTTSPSGAIVYAIGYSDQFWPGMCQGIGLWTSHDYGASFQQVDPTSGFPHNSGIPNEIYQYGRSLLSTSASSENTVYILTYDQGSNGVSYVYKSDDGGINYYITNGGNSLYTMGGNTDFDMVLKCSPYNAKICFACFEVPFRTINGGQSWPELSYSHSDFHAFDFCANQSLPNRVMIGGDGGVYSSEDLGSNWSNINQNLCFDQIWDICSNVYDGNSIDAGIEDEGVGYKNLNSGLNWSSTTIEDRDGTLVLSSPFKSNYFVASVGMCGHPMYYTTNGTNFIFSNNFSCNNINCPYVSCETESSWIPITVNHPSNPGVLYHVRFEDQTLHNGHYTPIYIMKTTDYGANWNGNNCYQFDNNDPNQLYLEPTSLAISQSNPNKMLLVLNGNYWNPGLSYSQLIQLETTDQGQTWSHNVILQVGNPEVPLRAISHVEFDPVNENEIYLTLSGYGTNHIYKSTNGGTNWAYIDGTGSTKLPNCPISDFIIHYTGSNSKEIIAAQDVGVWHADAQNLQWQAIAPNLPNSPILKLDHNRLSGILNCSAYGRGAWQVNLGGPIYVQDQLYITDNVTLPYQIVVAPGGKLILGHSAVGEPFTINFPISPNPGIIFQDGGELIANSGVAITLTCQGGAWGGIEFQGSGYGTLKNCTFFNTQSPITIDNPNGSSINTPITIKTCSFNNGIVMIDSRPNVNLTSCYFNWSNTTGSPNCGITATNSDYLYLCSNVINYSTTMVPGTGIQIVYGNNVVIYSDTINNTSNGILISNSSPLIQYNTITNTENTLAYVGIGLDNSPSAIINQNTVTDYQNGITLNNSSPIIYQNNIISNNPICCNNNALNANFNSFPQISPTAQGGGELLDAGYNNLESNITGDGIDIDITSQPYIDQGYNTIYGQNFYIWGTSMPDSLYYNATYNCWIDNPPVDNKFNLNGATVVYSPYSTNCGSGFGGSMKSDITIPLDKGIGGMIAEKALGINVVPSPQPIIVSYGHGIFDTIRVISKNVTVNPDMALYMQGINQEWLGNYSNAINTYHQVISNYKDSLTTKRSLIRLLYCHDKMHADSSAYTNLRNYYFSQIQINNYDTIFVKIGKDLAAKTLVRLSELPAAITEFENIISNSRDSLQIKNEQLNIIETYMLMHQHHGGSTFSFTGRYKQLKPDSIKQGYKMIRDLLYKHGNISKTKPIPTIYKLSQNYPNPFNPTTKIDFALPNATKVTIKVYDILGRLVRTLVNNEQKEAGYYTVTFDGTNFASGVYFYRIEAGKFVNVKKMVLVK